MSAVDGQNAQCTLVDVTVTPIDTSRPSRESRTIIRRVTPLAVLLIGAILIAYVGRWGPDWPAQEFRTWIATHEGLAVWSNAWYAGDSLISYSALYPLVSYVLGTPLTGVVAVLAIGLCSGRLAPSTGHVMRFGFQLSVAFVLCADLLIGQVPFLLGTALATAAFGVALSRRPRSIAVLLFSGASLASPIVALFVIVCTPALIRLAGVKRALSTAGVLVGLVFVALFGGVGGNYPYAISSLLEILGCCSVLLAISRRGTPLQLFALTYLAAALIAYVVPNPVGGDMSRLGELVLLPLAWHVKSQIRPMPEVRQNVIVGLVAVLSSYWVGYPAASAASRGFDDPSQNQSFYSGLLGFLARQDPAEGRIEVVFTREHWESLYVARVFSMARGWERQTDTNVNSVLYSPLTAGSYRAWLATLSVRFVALPTVPIDYGGSAEADLLKRPPAYLHKVYHDQDWTVWKVADSQPMISGPATIEHIGNASIDLEFRHPGAAQIKIHGSDFWQVTGGAACVSTAADGWLVVDSTTAGSVQLDAGLSWDAALGTSPSAC